MNGNTRFGWGYALAAMLFGVAIAMFAYNAGIADGAAGGTADAARGFQWGWHGGGILWPLFWVAFVLFVLSGSCGRRRYWYGRYPPDGPRWSDNDELDGWHRRAHEKMTEERPADNSGRRG
jgi:hypothetical protein